MRGYGTKEKLGVGVLRSVTTSAIPHTTIPLISGPHNYVRLHQLLVSLLVSFDLSAQGIVMFEFPITRLALEEAR